MSEISDRFECIVGEMNQNKFSVVRKHGMEVRYEKSVPNFWIFVNDSKPRIVRDTKSGELSLSVLDISVDTKAVYGRQKKILTIALLYDDVRQKLRMPEGTQRSIVLRGAGLCQGFVVNFMVDYSIVMVDSRHGNRAGADVIVVTAIESNTTQGSRDGKSNGNNGRNYRSR